MTSPSILREVRDFLCSLKKEWPEVFHATQRPKAEAEAAAPPNDVVIAFVAVDAPLKSTIAGDDLVSLFRSRAEYWAPFLGVTFNRINVKDQRTLWGSCTREGNLNFSWRLALAPDAVLDYLIVHELSHRTQMNHSRRFWEVVERVCPEHRSHRRWLRKNAAALHAARR
ncbi:MAG: M48 family metallopeptidase [Elusimicrobiota bacterium]